MTVNDLSAFARDLVQDVLATAEATETTAPDAFTQRMIEHLAEAGEIDDALVCYHQSRGLEVSGYGVDAENERVDLFVSRFSQDVSVPTLPRTELETLVRRLATFLRRCREGYSSQVDDASPAYDMVTDLERALRGTARVRLYVLTNGTSKLRTLPVDVDDVEAEVHVWDLERLHRLLTSGTLHEPIVVDFVDRFGAALPCLTTPETDKDYSVLMTIIPGAVLDSLYGEFGTRLLELNVRSFLQAKGSVNRGIRETLLKNPERFLAYNNGISATASRVETVTRPGGGQEIVRLHELQIVNGGQTTASIHSASRKDGADLSQVFVQAKVTVVSPERISAIVPDISKYSNTQNKVTTADFSSNDAFHVAHEQLSRAIWAPSPSGDGQETHWFYERARGQYADELARQRTPARQKAWKVNNPTRQKFTKTDLAKFENTYERLPHLVSRGAEKNFREFMIRLGGLPERPTVDETVFRTLIAKAILFRQTKKVVSEQNFGGYRANIVTYTIAKLVEATDGALDLDAVWRAQGITPALQDALAELSRPVQQALTNPPNGANIGEWCKNVKAWMRVQSIAWNPPPALASELLDRRAVRQRDLEAGVRHSTAVDQPLITRASAVPAGTWAHVAAWAKEAGRLEPYQRGLAANLGKRAERGLVPTAKQAEQGLSLLLEAVDFGFVPEPPLTAAVLGE